MREPAARTVIDAAAFDAALIRVVERAVGTAAADHAGARVMARLAARRWYPTVPQLLAVPAAVALVMVTLWHELRPLTHGAAPSTAAASREVSFAPADGAFGVDAAAPDHRGAEPRAVISAVPVAIAASGRRRARPRPTTPANDVADAVPALTTAVDAMAELTEPTPGPAPLAVDHLELPSIDAAALDPGRDQ